METDKTKSLGLFSAVIISLSGAFGIEFFTLLEHATMLAGPAVVISLLISGLLNILTMLSYCELGTSISKEGAEYTFVKASFGGFLSFLVGWLKWMACIFTISLSAIGFAQMIQYFIPVNPQFASISIILICTIINMKEVRKVDVAAVIAFIAIFAAFNSASLINGFRIGNMQPFFPNGVSGVLSGVMYTFSMFFGVRALIVKGAEIKEPGKNIPRAAILSSIILIITYCSVAFFAVGVSQPRDESPVPYLTYVAGKVLGPAGGDLLNLAGISAAIMSITTAMSIQTSIVSAMIRDGYMPKLVLSSPKIIGERNLVVISGSILAILFAATGLVIFVGYVVNFASLLIFAIVNISLLKLRKSMPRLIKPFKTPLYPFTPIIGVLFASLLIIFVESSALFLGFEFILFTIIIYHLRMMGYKRLRLAVGGVNFGVAAMMAITIVLAKTGIISGPQMFKSDIIVDLLILSCIIFLLSGVFNVIDRRQKP